MRYALLFVVLLTGCDSIITPANSQGDFRAVAAGVMSTQTVIAPAPAPDAGECENCRGTGFLGDGTVKVKCPMCGGDGRTDNAMPPPEISEDSYLLEKTLKEFEEFKASQAKPTLAPRPVAAPVYVYPRRGIFGRR